MTYRSMPFLAAEDLVLFCACDESQSKRLGISSSPTVFQPWRVLARTGGQDVAVSSGQPADAIEMSPTAYGSGQGWLVNYLYGTWQPGRLFRLMSIRTLDWAQFSRPTPATTTFFKARFSGPTMMAQTEMRMLDKKLVFVRKDDATSISLVAPGIRVVTATFVSGNDRRVIVCGDMPRRYSVLIDLDDGIMKDILVDGAPAMQASILGGQAAHLVQLGDEDWQTDVVLGGYSLEPTDLGFELRR